ncbi:MAG: ABC transporter permease [Acidobacteriota bacterium]
MSRKTRPKAWSSRCFDYLLGLYPRSFQERFGDEMSATFEREIADARNRGRAAVAKSWARTVIATLRCAIPEHIDAMRQHRQAATGSTSRGDRWMHCLTADILTADVLTADVRHAVRRMAAYPGFAVIAILTIGLGIGVNAAVFSLIDTILLRPLPFNGAERLVRVWSAQPTGDQRFLDSTIDELRTLREQNRVFAEVAGLSLAPRDLHDAAGAPRGIVVGRISAGFFDVLGVAPILGRGPTPEEYASGAPVVVLSHGFWQTRYGGRRDVVGESIAIQGLSHRVAGVMPKTFRYPQQAILWRPFTQQENQDDDRELQVVARLHEGVSLEQASADIALVLAGLPAGESEDAATTGWAQPLQAMLVEDVRRPFWLLFAAVVAVLAIACANVANLQLVQGAGRARELAVRTALGASRRRLVTQVLTESLMVAACGGLLGLFLGSWLLRLMVQISPADLPRLAEVQLDVRVAAVMLAVTAAAGILFGLVPALRAARGEPIAALRGGRATLGRGGQRLQQLFAVGQIAMATLLVVSAGLLTATFINLDGAERGFSTRNVMTVDISPPRDRDTSEQRLAFYQEVHATLSDLPGTESVALTNFHPMQDFGFRIPFQIVGQPTREGEARPRALLRSTTHDFFHTAGIEIVAGRDFNVDEAGGVAIVNEAFVRAFLPAADPLRERLSHPAYFGEDRPAEHQIIGIAANVRADATAAAVKPRIYLPYHHMPWPRMEALVRWSDPAMASAAAVRERLWSLDATIPVDVVTMQEWIEESVAAQRFNMKMMSSFAGLALMLATLGIYGVLSSTVARRAREIGLRVALGASWRSIVRMVLRRGLRLSLTGVAIGLVTASGATRLLNSLLFGIRPLEPWLLLSVAAGFVAVALAASALPALRALRVDPLNALRVE